MQYPFQPLGAVLQPHRQRFTALFFLIFFPFGSVLLWCQPNCLEQMVCALVMRSLEIDDACVMAEGKI